MEELTLNQMIAVIRIADEDIKENLLKYSRININTRSPKLSICIDVPCDRCPFDKTIVCSTENRRDRALMVVEALSNMFTEIDYI